MKKSFIQKNISIIVSGLCCAALVGCGSAKDADKIGAAQACLDKATSTTAQSCVTGIASISGQSADLVRCSAGFIQQGFDDPNRITNAFSQLNGSVNSNFLSVFAFDTAANADATFGYCQNAGSQGSLFLACFVEIATALNSISTTNSTCQAVGATGLACGIINMCTAGYSGKSAVKNSIGAAAIVAYSTSCSSSKASGNQTLCNTLSAAGANGTASASTVGGAFVGQLAGTISGFNSGLCNLN